MLPIPTFYNVVTPMKTNKLHFLVVYLPLLAYLLRLIKSMKCTVPSRYINPSGFKMQVVNYHNDNKKNNNFYWTVNVALAKSLANISLTCLAVAGE